ncbi:MULTISPECIES: HAD-IA family hydrolase [Rhizobium]|nr:MULTISPECIES: HAD-IA family hydrolase [Rhizobium]
MAKIVGHRGAPNLWPENSLEGFREALELAVDAIEFDVHLTDAGELVVIHDATLDLDLLIFDCDGVLIDSESISARTLAHAVTQAGVDMTPRQILIEFTGKSEGELRQALIERGLADVDAVLTAWHKDIYAAFGRELRPMEGIGDIVAELDVAKCVASNSTVERLGNSLGLLPLWSDFAPNVFSAEMVAAPKPSPDLVEFCLSKMNASRERSVMIDDSAAGIEAAVAAGVRAIGFVDPNDPRSGRREVLLAAGAEDVAFGADELRLILQRLGAYQARAERPMEVEA